MAGFLGLSLIQQGGLTGIEWGTCAWMFLNAFLTLLAYPLVPLLEKLFGFTTKITLSELSDMNQPLLQELSIKAPGTLQHSMQVANLSEAAARAVGADTQLVKVAALYHDVGKVAKPHFYIENQKGENPHSEITALESAKIIIEHVTEGVKMAKKNGLPQVLIDFIITHHGTTRVEYFYRNHLKEHPDEPKDDSLFRYSGPKPHTREQTIMMIADSLEAASKSLKQPSQEEINQLVENIIKSKMDQGQLEDSPLTFAELKTCKEVFKSTLASMNHIRVKYPEGKV
jgi:putative nucleotidyltransferase with HDIG domain